MGWWDADAGAASRPRSDRASAPMDCSKPFICGLTETGHIYAGPPKEHTDDQAPSCHRMHFHRISIRFMRQKEEQAAAPEVVVAKAVVKNVAGSGEYTTRIEADEPGPRVNGYLRTFQDGDMVKEEFLCR